MFRGDREKKIELETYAPIIDFSVICLILPIAAQNCHYIAQLDFQSAFLQAWIQRTVYMRAPNFLEIPDNEDLVCQLTKVFTV